MRYAAVLIVLVILAAFSCKAHAQDWQSTLMFETRTGVASNPYLNPLLPGWDREGTAGYMLFAPIGQTVATFEDFSAEFVAGGMYKPFFDDRDAWSGLFGVASARYRLSGRFAAGLEAGGSNINAATDNRQFWLQPVFTWSPSLFSQFRFRAGSSFGQLSYSIPDEDNGETMNVIEEVKRYDSYTLEYETWPTLRWQFRSMLYGNLDAPASNIGLRGFANYRFRPDIQLHANIGFERFGYELSQFTQGGGPPFGGGAIREEITDEADRVLRAGAGATWQLFPNIALNAQADVMNYSSSVEEGTFNDFQLSAGVRFSFSPARRADRGRANVEWMQNDTQTVILNLNYSGDGQLFILGNFNNWDKPGEPLVRQSGSRYAVRLSLEPGLYEYKILLLEGSEERWIDFTEETYTVSDGFGGENGLIFIE